MADCFDYLDWRGDIPFSADLPNEVDGMLLSRFAYCPFELAEANRELTIGQVCCQILDTENFEEHLVQRQDKRLLEGFEKAERFSKLLVFAYENTLDVQTETQFSAVTIRLAPDLHYVAFRGTDDTLVGWKEDFNMSFTFPVRAQILAVEYLEKIARKVRGRIICGGHSKGGNLAVYAAAFCKRRVQNRVVAVENFDGPGFMEAVLSLPGYVAIRDRIRTYVPKSSVVGLLLFHEEEYTIVESSYTGLLQHDTYSWEVVINRFKYLEKVTDASRFLDITLKEWIASMPNEKREKLIDALYEIIAETKAQTLGEFTENWFFNTITIAKKFKKLDDETKKLLGEALRALAEGAKKTLYSELQNR